MKLKNQEIISSKILEAESYMIKLFKALEVVSLLDDGDLHDQLSNWVIQQETLTWVIKRFVEVGVIDEK